ncbi:nucleotidyltransferase family protein [Coxiella-like endosymbiont]|uniref:nucleotidyltransferase family protein n=1 Tax=Coxiella-like endosymbiont TaxID=1592897 RepID=UPI00272A1824|nr:sugar phosphate nucleotidyltransferase [Coxiella-like endosymbiont]
MILALAAGHDSRLKPLTNSIPKPLLSVGTERLIEHNLKMLSVANIHEVVINIFHHANKIMDCLGNGERYGVTIYYPYEPNPLGTGRGIFFKPYHY